MDVFVCHYEIWHVVIFPTFKDGLHIFPDSWFILRNHKSISPNEDYACTPTRRSRSLGLLVKIKSTRTNFQFRFVNVTAFFGVNQTRRCWSFLLLPPLPGRSCKGFMHMKFTRSAEGRYVLGENSPPFSTIPEVIHYYTTHKLPIRGAEHMSLLYPVIVQTLWHWRTHTFSLHVLLLVLLNTLYTQYLHFSASFLSYLPFFFSSISTWTAQRLDCLVPSFPWFTITPVTTLAAW